MTGMPSSNEGCGGLPVFPRRFFVTGTDTNVGKTIVSAILVAGLKAFYWKPIQSGIIDGTDSKDVQRLSGCESCRILPERYVLNQPLSPHASAAIDGVRISLSDIELPDVEGPLVVEGAGGIMVPLNENELVVDLIAKFALPVIVVARSGLGTINHTVLTVAALRRRGADIFGVVMNGELNEGNRQAIEHYADVKVLAQIQPLRDLSPSEIANAFSAFSPAVGSECTRVSAHV
jgi:dethiobiotin synthetase